jgi:hypothetical protein
MQANPQNIILGPGRYPFCEAKGFALEAVKVHTKDFHRCIFSSEEGSPAKDILDDIQFIEKTEYDWIQLVTVLTGKHKGLRAIGMLTKKEKLDRVAALAVALTVVADPSFDTPVQLRVLESALRRRMTATKSGGCVPSLNTTSSAKRQEEKECLVSISRSR